MINQELLNFIKDAAQQGQSREQIVKSLLGVGWQTSDIEENFDLALSGPRDGEEAIIKDDVNKSKKSLLFAVVIFLVLIFGSGVAAYYFYFAEQQDVSEEIKLSNDYVKEESISKEVPNQDVDDQKSGIKNDTIFSRVDENLILATIKKHEDVALLGTIYMVSREMKDDKGSIVENIKYNIQLSLPIDKITIIEGVAKDPVMMSSRYHSMISELKKRLENKEISKNKFGQYEIIPPNSKFKAVFKIDTANNLLNDYEFYMDDDLVMKSHFQVFDNFSKIIVESIGNDNGLLNEIYIKQ